MAGAVPAAAVLLLCLFYQVARIRFRALLTWQGGLVFALTLGVMTASGFPPAAGSGTAPEMVLPVGQLLCWQFGLLFPWSLLLLPALGSVAAQLSALRPLEWDEALPLAWLAAAFAMTLADPTLFSPLLFWPAFAVWGAQRLKTMHRLTFLWGCALSVLAACGGLYLTQRLHELLPLLFPAKTLAIAAIPDFFWLAVQPIAFIAMLAFLLFAAAAFCAEILHNRRFALLGLFAAMIPAGFAFADIGAKFAPWFSDAATAGCIEANPQENRPIYLNASPFETSSLRFYLSEASLRQMTPRAPSQGNSSLLLVTPRSHLPYWKQVFGDRLSVACESGEHLLLAVRAE